MVSEPAGSITPYFNVADRGDALLAHRHDQILGREPQLAQLGQVELSLADDDGRLSVEQTAEETALSERMLSSTSSVTSAAIGTRPKKQRNAEILHGHGGKVADENGHDELGRVHLSELALSHQPHRADDREIQHERAHERHGHETASFFNKKYAVIV